MFATTAAAATATATRLSGAGDRLRRCAIIRGGVWGKEADSSAAAAAEEEDDDDDEAEEAVVAASKTRVALTTCAVAYKTVGVLSVAHMTLLMVKGRWPKAWMSPLPSWTCPKSRSKEKVSKDY